MKSAPALLLPIVFLSACTSVKVNRVAHEKLPKVPLREVQLISAEAAKTRPNDVIASIDMRTRSPFAADLNQVARERTAKLGGHAYVITSGHRETTMSGGFGSVFGDSTSATMNIDVLRWQDAPVPEPRGKKPAAAPAPNAAPAAAPAPEKPRKAKSWWRPWTWF